MEVILQPVPTRADPIKNVSELGLSVKFGDNYLVKKLQLGGIHLAS